MKHEGGKIAQAALLGSMLSQHPRLQSIVARQQRYEALAVRLAAVYQVSTDDVYATAAAYPWTFETFYEQAMAGRVTMRRRRIGRTT